VPGVAGGVTSVVIELFCIVNPLSAVILMLPVSALPVLLAVNRRQLREQRTHSGRRKAVRPELVVRLGLPVLISGFIRSSFMQGVRHQCHFFGPVCCPGWMFYCNGYFRVRDAITCVVFTEITLFSLRSSVLFGMTITNKSSFSFCVATWR
jgi:hypothetical protein